MTSAAGTALSRPKSGLILPVVAAAQFVLVLDIAIVNLALPTIRDELGFGAGGLQWVVNAYLLAFGGFLLLGGRAADLFGRCRLFLGSLGAFTAASLACGLAQSAEMLVAARAAQGLSAAVLSPATLAILTATYAAPEARARALSVWTALAVGGGAVGALLGGLLTELLSWRWIFLVNVPLGLLVLAAAASVLPRNDVPAKRGAFDIAGAVLVTGALVALVWAVIRVPEDGWESVQVVGGLVAFAILLAGFVAVERLLARSPLVPPGILRIRSVTAGNLLMFANWLAVLPTWFVLSLYLQGPAGHGALAASLTFLPVSAGVIVGAQTGYRMIGSVGPRPLLAGGGILAAAGLIWLGRLAADDPLLWVIAPAVVGMAGSGLMFAPITWSATSGVPPALSGLASGLLTTTQQIGGALGLAILTTLAASEAASRAGESTRDALTAGYGLAFTISGAICAASALAGTWLLPPSRATALRGSRADEGRSP